MIRIILTTALVLFAFSAWAAKTYTPQQLNQMVDSGNYPKQGNVVTQTRVASFEECKFVVESSMSAIQEHYPVRAIVDTDFIYVVKAWTNDAAVTGSCTKAQNELVVTQANYE